MYFCNFFYFKKTSTNIIIYLKTNKNIYFWIYHVTKIYKQPDISGFPLSGAFANLSILASEWLRSIYINHTLSPDIELRFSLSRRYWMKPTATYSVYIYFSIGKHVSITLSIRINFV